MTKLLRRRDGISVREVDGELLILDTDTNKVHQLNETASFVWRNIENAGSAEALEGLLAERYAAQPDRLVEDVREIVRRLVVLGLVFEEQ
jgi:hypothetical protein